MRTVKWALIVGGVSALALVFVGRVAADSFNAKDFGRPGGTTFAFRMVPVKSFSSDSGSTSGLATAPRQDILRVGVFTATADPDICTTSGTPPITTCTPSTHGTLTGRTIATTDTNAGNTRVIVFNWTGEFKVNSNGTGVFTVEAASGVTCFDPADNAVVAPLTAPPYPPPPAAGAAPAGGQACTFGGATSVEGPESYAFVIVRTRRLIEFTETDNGPGGGGAKIFLTGSATKQVGPEESN